MEDPHADVGWKKDAGILVVPNWSGLDDVSFSVFFSPLTILILGANVIVDPADSKDLGKWLW